MENIFMSVMIIIGTLIGAGFASGQEIASFFNRFLDNGRWGIMLASILFGLVTFFVLKVSSKLKATKYEELAGRNKFALLIIKGFSFICYCIMISAIGSYGEQQYGLSFWVGSIVAGIIMFLLFLFKFKGLEKINNYLVPFILIGIAFLAFVKYDSTTAQNLSNVLVNRPVYMNNWVLSSILYMGYNSIILVPILIELNAYKLKNKDIAIISILVTLILAVAGLIIFSALNVYYPEIISVELPTLILASSVGKIATIVYSIIILFAIFTTAFSCGFAFLEMNSEKHYFKNTVIICILGSILSRIGFSNMIDTFFPIFGYAGIVQIIILFISCKRKKIGVDKIEKN